MTTQDTRSPSNDSSTNVDSALGAAWSAFRSRGGAALLIGVEDYRVFDGSGAKDLPAGRNDVLAWWKVCRRLGFKRIRALTSPELTEDDLVHAELELVPELGTRETADQVRARVRRWMGAKEPALEFKGASTEEIAAGLTRWAEAMKQPSSEVIVSLGPATSAQVKEGVRWLSGAVAFHVAPPSGMTDFPGIYKAMSGVMTYSGHGARGKDDLVLCPTDIGSGLANALPFADLRAVFEERPRDGGGEPPIDSLTIVLDCCFAGSSDSLGKTERVATLTPGAAGRKVPVPRAEIGNRVLCASARDRQSSQAMLGGHWHGAFTWALTAALEQWKLKEEGDSRRSTMSYDELLFRARTLLRALSFYQHPILVDELGSLPVFHRGSADGDETSTDPDTDRPGGQVDPDYLVGLTMSNAANASWQIVTTGANPPATFLPNTEYWAITQTFLNAIAGASTSGSPTTLTLASSPRGTTLPSSSAKVLNIVGGQWTQQATVRPAGNNFWYDDTANSRKVGLQFALSSAGGVWTGSITWWVASTATTAPAGAVVTGTTSRVFTYGANPAPPANTTWTWFSMTLPAQLQAREMTNKARSLLLQLPNDPEPNRAMAALNGSGAWYFIPVPDGSGKYNILNTFGVSLGTQPGQYLDIGESNKVRCKVNLNNDNQKWTVTKSGSTESTYYISSTVDGTTYYLSLDGSDKAVGVTTTPGDTEKWTLTPPL